MHDHRIFYASPRRRFIHCWGRPVLVVVVGPPAAGKSTYIEQHAAPGDIVIDFDRLAVALAPPGAPSHDHGWHLRNVALRARDAAVRSALRVVAQCDVWLIHSVPSSEAILDYRAGGVRGSWWSTPGGGR
ncbi:AAA family ATPase [Kitasatospora sp. NPDC088391]|uniref:AAA family ATPase n=1 Tax=Kitasatospora sp. NPDC088391 TaxID=3364074 RepID=UPI0038092718